MSKKTGSTTRTILTDLEADLRIIPATFTECRTILRMEKSDSREQFSLLEIFAHLYHEDGSHDYTQAEASRVLGVTREAIRQRRTKMLRRLRHELKEA